MNMNKSNPVVPYEGVCKECFTDIPDDAKFGDSCVTCGYVLVEPPQVSDCPFCGFLPSFYEPDFIHPVTRPDKNGRQVWRAHCYECGGGCGASTLGDSKEGALVAWNRRPL